MDINAINTLISKEFYKYKNVKTIKFGFYDENTVGITLDGYVMWFIPNDLFIFDANKLSRGVAPLDVKCLVHTNGLENAVRTNELIKTEKGTLTIFKSEKVEVFVDTKLLKVFDKNSTYKITKPYQPVLVYENDILVGLVCPTRYER